MSCVPSTSNPFQRICTLFTPLARFVIGGRRFTPERLDTSSIRMYLIGIDLGTSLKGQSFIPYRTINFTQLIHSELLSARNEFDPELDTFFVDTDDDNLFSADYDSYIESVLGE